ncbi:hypothetical protein D3C80_2096860 [compost metagenome]
MVEFGWFLCVCISFFSMVDTLEFAAFENSVGRERVNSRGVCPIGAWESGG